MEERRLGETPTLPASQSTGSEEFEREYTKQFCSHVVRDEVLVVENDVEKGTVNLQYIAGAIIDEPQFPEPVHEEADPRPGCADHLRQGLLADLGDYRLGYAFFAKMSKQ